MMMMIIIIILLQNATQIAATGKCCWAILCLGMTPKVVDRRRTPSWWPECGYLRTPPSRTSSTLPPTLVTIDKIFGGQRPRNPETHILIYQPSTSHTSSSNESLFDVFGGILSTACASPCMSDRWEKRRQQASFFVGFFLTSLLICRTTLLTCVYVSVWWK